MTLISGGNDETDGNVQLVRRRNGYSVDGHLVEIHPEIGQAASSEVMPGTGCAVLAAERPQLVVTNLMVASAMLNALWAVTEQGSVPYSEVYLDVVHNAARSRSLVPRPGRRAVGECGVNRCNGRPGRRQAALPGRTMSTVFVTGVVTVVTDTIRQPIPAGQRDLSAHAVRA